MGELVSHALFHHVEFYGRPIGAQREGFAGVFGFGGGWQRGDSAALVHVQRFGGLVGVLDVGIVEAFEFHLSGIEVGEETILALEGIDFWEG